MSYFDKNLKGKTKLAAPVQSNEDGWRDYLSARENTAYDKAARRGQSAVYVTIGAVAITWGSIVVLGGASLAALPLAAIAALVSGISGVTGAYNLVESTLIRRQGERREADAEAAASQRCTPRGPSA
jgi:hypothetical protein